MNRFEPGACCSPILRESARFLVAADGDIEMGGVNARDEIFNFVDRVNANIFRAVRDLAGHAATEFQFGPAGRERISISRSGKQRLSDPWLARQRRDCRTAG